MAGLAGARTRLVNAVPPQWVEIARSYPALWMVALPVVLGLSLILIVYVGQPAPSAVAGAPRAVASAAVPSPPSDVAAAAAARPAVENKFSKAALAELEGKAPASLSVEELLLVNQGRAEHKREEAKALSRKLQEQPELAKDATVQAQLLRLAADPDTASVALVALAHAPSPVGSDLLYEVWTSRPVATGTAELARSLLYSREVRPTVSPALAVALDLRGAETCEATQAALPQARSAGDRRALGPLAKLNSRRGCGAKKTEDCYACLRAKVKPLLATIDAVKRRTAPSYPTR